MAKPKSLPKFKDARIANVIYDFLDDVKGKSGESDKLFSAYHMSNEYLANISAEDITQESLSNYFDTVRFRKGWDISSFLHIILRMIKAGLPVGTELFALLNLEDYISVQSSTKTLLDVMHHNISNYYVSANRGVNNSGMLYFIDAEGDLRYLLIEYLDLWNDTDLGIKAFVGEFQTSIKKHLFSASDIDISCFYDQVEYIRNHPERNQKKFIKNVVRFYNWIRTEKNIDIFAETSFPSYMIERMTVTTELLSGYNLVAYNPMEDIPSDDKWIFYYGNIIKSNVDEKNGGIVAIDFSRINNPTYREWTKSYVWHDSASMYTKLVNMTACIDFWNFITEIKSGRMLTIYTTATSNIIPATNEVIAYKNKVFQEYESDITRCGKVYGPRAILSYLKDADMVALEEGVFFYLTYTRGNTSNNKDVISQDELKKIASAASELSKESSLYALCHLIYYIGLETEFRISQVLALDVDCVKETGMKNKYVVRSRTKTSYGEYQEQPITVYTKRHIDEIIRLTEDTRNRCENEDLKRKLFITERFHRISQFKVVQGQDFIRFMKECCERAETPVYTYANLRNTHMTLAEEKVIREGLSDMYQGVLSGHASTETDSRYYVNTNIRNMLESVHGVIIGNVNVAGEIYSVADENITKPENLVSHQCGYCKASACNNLGYLDCMMCSSFATTFSRLPYFEEQIRMLDGKIQEATTPHDKEDLVNIKRLCLSYVEEIMKKQEEDHAV